MRRLVGWVVALCALVGLSGCGSSTSGTPMSVAPSVPATGVEGTSVVSAAENPIPLDRLWDPINLTDPAIFAPLGVDPQAGKDCSDNPPNTRSCSWNRVQQGQPGGEFGVFVYSSKQSFDEVLHDKRLSHFVETEVDGHRAVRYQLDGKGPNYRCDMAWGTSFGSVWVTVDSGDQNNEQGGVDTCGILPKWAALVYPHVPK